MSETKERRTVVEAVKNAKRYSDGTIMLYRVRCSYPHTFEAQESTNDAGKVTKSFSVLGLMDKTTHDDAKKLLVREVNRILKESNRGEKLAADRKFIRDGDPRDDDDVGKPENAGCWIVSTREQKRPINLSNRNDPETGKPRRLSPDNPEDVEMIYGGCYINMLIRPWWQSNVNGKRVNAGILVVQFAGDGEPFGRGRIRDEDIDATFDGEDDGGSIDDDDDPL